MCLRTKKRAGRKDSTMTFFPAVLFIDKKMTVAAVVCLRSKNVALQSSFPEAQKWLSEAFRHYCLNNNTFVIKKHHHLCWLAARSFFIPPAPADQIQSHKFNDLMLWFRAHEMMILTMSVVSPLVVFAANGLKWNGVVLILPVIIIIPRAKNGSVKRTRIWCAPCCCDDDVS